MWTLAWNSSKMEIMCALLGRLVLSRISCGSFEMKIIFIFGIVIAWTVICCIILYIRWRIHRYCGHFLIWWWWLFCLVYYCVWEICNMTRFLGIQRKTGKKNSFFWMIYVGFARWRINVDIYVGSTQKAMYNLEGYTSVSEEPDVRGAKYMSALLLLRRL